MRMIGSEVHSRAWQTRKERIREGEESRTRKKDLGRSLDTERTKLVRLEMDLRGGVEEQDQYRDQKRE